MSVREALEMAKECLQERARSNIETPWGSASNIPALVIEQIDAALRELAEAKPVAWECEEIEGDTRIEDAIVHRYVELGPSRPPHGTRPLYTTPPAAKGEAQPGERPLNQDEHDVITRALMLAAFNAPDGTKAGELREAAIKLFGQAKVDAAIDASRGERNE